MPFDDDPIGKYGLVPAFLSFFIYCFIDGLFTAFGHKLFDNNVLHIFVIISLSIATGVVFYWVVKLFTDKINN